VSSSSTSWNYGNRTGRKSGLGLRTVGRLVPGIGRVQRQIVPYAARWHAANASAVAEPGPRWIVLGDSMSQGVGASAFDAGWVNQARRRLLAEGTDYRIVNLAASGARVSDVLEMQLPALRSLPNRSDGDPRPDVVTVLIGSNDLFRRAYRNALPDRFAELLRELPSGTFVATLPNPRPAAQAVNAVIEEAARVGRIELVEMRRGQGIHAWRGRLADDHFHPNDLGYAELAGAFAEAMSAAARRPAAAAETK
jgi:lysophospholipase L1-like esterase